MLKVGQKLKNEVGRTVEIIAVLDRPDNDGYSIVGLRFDTDGSREITTYQANGRYMLSGKPSCCDLVMPREIETLFVHPPIPDRRCDWCAWYSGADEDGPRGWGPSETEAIADLENNYPREEAEAA